MTQYTPTCSQLEKFWARVDKTGTCWEWLAAKNKDGYGQAWMTSNGRAQAVRVHRVAYEMEYGSIPSGVHLDHTCHNRACLNPAHLRVTTPKQNQENRLGAEAVSASGVRGVSWRTKDRKWVAQVKHHGHSYHVGFFDNIPDAEAAVIAKRNELFTHNDLDRVA